MIRILHIGMTSNPGGLESFIMNIYRKIDRNLVQFDFVAMYGTKIPYEDEINSLGGHVYYIIFPKKDLRRFTHPINSFLEDKQYRIIHHHRTHLGDLNYLWQAKKSSIPTRIIHSHSSGYISKLNIITKVSELLNKRMLNYVATDLWSCSKLAGDWMFNDNEYSIIPNAIDLESYRFDKSKREFYRKKFNIEKDEILIGHVGSFFSVKNHEFIIDFFQELNFTTHKRYKLLLIGEGNEFNKIKQKVNDLNLTDKIIFLGTRNDVNELMNSFDLFILPSKFEGLPIVAIEAQANGLPSILSNNITSEVVLSPNVYQLSIDDKSHWINFIENMDLSRKDNFDKLKLAGYDINELAEKMQKLYLRLYNNN